eukprot:4648683-Amphidinium_carterae.1
MILEYPVLDYELFVSDMPILYSPSRCMRGGIGESHDVTDARLRHDENWTVRDASHSHGGNRS